MHFWNGFLGCVVWAWKAQLRLSVTFGVIATISSLFFLRFALLAASFVGFFWIFIGWKSFYFMRPRVRFAFQVGEFAFSAGVIAEQPPN